MRLRDLEAKFLRHDQRRPMAEEIEINPQFPADRMIDIFHTVETLGEAQGVEFLCPLCFAANNGPIGTHAVICWFHNRNVPDNLPPLPGRWNPQGTGLDDLTFVPPGAVSVLLLGEGCKWHGFVRNGDAT